MNRNSAIIILRWGLAFTFFYASIASLLSPENWIGYLPIFVASIIPPRAALTLYSFYEIALAALLFAGWKLKLAAALATISLAAITVLNLNVLDVVFRDVGLAFMALALWELVKQEKPKSREGEIV